MHAAVKRFFAFNTRFAGFLPLETGAQLRLMKAGGKAMAVQALCETVLAAIGGTEVENHFNERGIDFLSTRAVYFAAPAEGRCRRCGGRTERSGSATICLDKKLYGAWAVASIASGCYLSRVILSGNAGWGAAWCAPRKRYRN